MSLIAKIFSIFLFSFSSYFVAKKISEFIKINSKLIACIATFVIFILFSPLVAILTEPSLTIIIPLIGSAYYGYMNNAVSSTQNKKRVDSSTKPSVIDKENEDSASKNASNYEVINSRETEIGPDKTRTSLKVSFDNGLKHAQNQKVKKEKEALMVALDYSLVLRFRMMGRNLNDDIIVLETWPFLFMSLDLARECVAEYIVYIHWPESARLDWLQTELKKAFKKGKEYASPELIPLLESGKYQIAWFHIMEHAKTQEENNEYNVPKDALEASNKVVKLMLIQSSYFEKLPKRSTAPYALGYINGMINSSMSVTKVNKETILGAISFVYLMIYGKDQASQLTQKSFSYDENKDPEFRKGYNDGEDEYRKYINKENYHPRKWMGYVNEYKPLS